MNFIFTSLVFLFVLLFSGCVSGIVGSVSDNNKVAFQNEIKTSSQDDKNDALFYVFHNHNPNAKYYYLDKLLKNGANPYSFSKTHNVSYIESLSHNSFDIFLIKILMDNGNDINKLDDRKLSLLYHFSYVSPYNELKELIALGAKPTFSVLQAAIFTPKSIDRYKIIELYLQNGADPFSKDSDGKMPYNYANERGFFEIVKLFDSYEDDKISFNKCKKVDTISCYENLIVENNKYKIKINELLVLKTKKSKQKEEEIVKNYLIKNDLKGLKTYTDTNPNAVYYINNKELRLALTGPKGLKVGDIQKLLKEEDEVLVLSLIKRAKTPYKEYSLDEIKILKSMGLSSNIIASMIDVTTQLLRDTKLRNEQTFFLKEQRRIKKNRSNKKTVRNNSSNSIIENEVSKELTNRGMKMLFDNLF